MAETVFDQIMQAIAKGELETCLIQLRTALAHHEDGQAILKVTIQLQGDLRDLERARAIGTISPKEELDERKKLRQALTDLVQWAKRDVNSRVPLALPVAKIHVSTAPPPPAELERIIGADRMMSLAWMRRGLQRARAVCRVVAPRGVGTGFLLKGGLLVTNRHVIQSAEDAGNTLVEFNYEEDESGALTLVHQYLLDPSQCFATGSNETEDCTIVAVGNPVGTAEALEQWGYLELKPRPLNLGQHVSIIQHPSGGVKKIAVSENQVVAVRSPTVVQYTTDTMPGSSGSPVFDDDWNVVALHHGSTSDQGKFVNEGLLAAFVIQVLEPRLKQRGGSFP